MLHSSWWTVLSDFGDVIGGSYHVTIEIKLESIIELEMHLKAIIDCVQKCIC